MRNGKLSRRAMLKASTALAAGAIGTQSLDAFAQPSAVQAALIARAKSFELDTPYVPPPGNALEHHASGFTKIMCSAVFVTGLDPDFAAENVGYRHGGDGESASRSALSRCLLRSGNGSMSGKANELGMAAASGATEGGWWCRCAVIEV
jgi:hypothetical protein